MPAGAAPQPELPPEGTPAGSLEPAVPRVPHPAIGVGLVMLAAALWSLNGPLIKVLNAPHGDGKGADAIAIACYRSLIGGLILLPLAWRRRGSLRGTAPRWTIFSVSTFTIMTICFVSATTMTAAANAIILQYTAPLWVFALSPLLLREHIARRQLWLILLATLGVMVIFFGNMYGKSAEAAGLTIALISGAGFGALIVALRGLKHVDPTVVVTLNTLGSGVVLAIIGLFTGGLWVSGFQLGVLALMAIVQFTLPYILFSIALRHVGAARASLLTLLEVILNPLWTFLIVQETPPQATLLGGPIILIAVALAILEGRRSPSANRAAGSAARD